MWVGSLFEFVKPAQYSRYWEGLNQCLFVSPEVQRVRLLWISNRDLLRVMRIDLFEDNREIGDERHLSVSIRLSHNNEMWLELVV